MISRLVELPPFSFWVREEGTGTPIVLLHGLGGSSDWWNHNLDALSRDHRVCAIDLVGFGRNRFFLQRSHLPLAFDEIASLLARWIETDLGQPAHVVGNSMGGHIAIHLAALRPDLVRSLTLVNSTGVPFRVAPWEHLRNLFLPRGLWSFLLVLIRDAFRAGPTALAVAFSRLLRDDARVLMRELRVPVLLLWGESDPLVPLRYAKEMLVEIRNARLEIIPHAAHVPMWENPEAFNHILLRFLNEMDAARIDAAPSVFSWALAGWSGGVAYRQAGRAPNVVLVHGLGMSSSYFVRLAEALFDLGLSPIAPDLPGFGESVDGRASSPKEHADLLAVWADMSGIEDAIWVGHSTGCNAVARVAQTRPDLVHATVHIGPLWRKGSAWSLLPRLLLDAFREPLGLFPFVIRGYWRTGFARWVKTFRRYAVELRYEPPPGLLMVGYRDPLVDRDWIANFIVVPGAHACLFSNPREVATALTGPR